jgi:UDPglucose--hexose-1-phosphate uridylyltransferase
VAPAREFRFDALTREWVNIVGGRQDRPNLPSTDCPFCVGGLEAPHAYEVTWFANRWPALAPGAPIDLAAAEASGTTCLPAAGACEVVLFSPDHTQSLSGLGATGIRSVVDVWAERTTALLARPEIEYVLVFETRGREVGATIDHPHGQIYGYPFVPPVPAREAAIALKYDCPVCEETEREAADGSRVVYDDGEWMAWVPYASGYSYGLRIAPRSHHRSLPSLDYRDRDRLSALLADVLARYDRLWPPPHPGYLFPYLLWFHQAPARGSGEWHLHAHTAPPLRAPGTMRFVASGELGSGVLSNPVVPEDAAKALRDA